MSLPNPIRAVVLDLEIRTTKQNKLYLQTTIKTRVGPVRCFMWDIPPDAHTNPNYPHVGDIIYIDTLKDQMAERNSIVIQSFHRITKDVVPPEDQVIFDVYKASEEEMKSAFALLKDSSFWDAPIHHRFTMACLAKLDLNKLRISPAAAQIHHSYSGGLIVHTAEVLALCKAYVEVAFHRYSFINKDVLYASCILHDIGKISTYEFNEMGMAHQLIVEKTIGHMYYAMHLVQTVFDEGKIVVEPEFASEVIHAIASHHGSIEWGSIVEPQSIESGVLSRMDYISSRNGMMEKVLKENVQSGQPVQQTFTIYQKPYFLSLGIKKYMEEKGIDAAVKMD